MGLKTVGDIVIAESVRSLESYDIQPVVRSGSFAAAEIEAPPKGAVVGEGILSFASNLSSQNQQDVQHAFLFATLVANKLFPHESQGREWYAKFVEVMTNSGWMPTQKFYDDLKVGGNTVRMDQLVLDILSSLVAGISLGGASSALILKVAGTAIAGLQEKKKALTLFEKNVLDHSVGGIAAGTCTEVNGEVTLLLGTVRFNRRNRSTQVLFVDWSSREVKLYKGETVFRKVPAVVESVRHIIVGKLGGHAVSKIEEYEI